MHCRQTHYTLSHQRKDLGNDERLVTHFVDTNTVYLTKDETHLGKKKWREPWLYLLYSVIVHHAFLLVYFVAIAV